MHTVYNYNFYAYNGATVSQQTASLGARWKRTTLDGFGRGVKVESGHDSNTVSVVDSEYAACACSPLGKLKRVSQPHAPGATPIWTTYTYDGSGRTTAVTAPDGSTSTTEYLTSYGAFSGDLVRTTDPAGKWKIQHTDIDGRLIHVIGETGNRGKPGTVTNSPISAIPSLTRAPFAVRPPL
jgi:hypothetical protein